MGMTARLDATFRRLRRAAAATLTVGAVLTGLSTAAAEPVVVAELYTSQGCNSCPPADRLVGELSSRAGVLPLSFHIDYWDYLGWRDSFAQPEHADRQRAYRAAMRVRAIYTPQIVLQGRTGVIGNRRAEVEAAIETLSDEPRRVDIEARRGDGELVIQLTPQGDPLAAPVEVWAIGYDGPHSVEILRGENAGETITYHNVVRGMRRIGDWDGAGAATLRLALPADAPAGQAVILQRGLSDPNEKLGPILAAARAE